MLTNYAYKSANLINTMLH